MSPERLNVIADEWADFAGALRLDLPRLAFEDRAAAEALARVWTAAAKNLRVHPHDVPPLECFTCGRSLIPFLPFIGHANAVQAAAESALPIAFSVSGYAPADCNHLDTRRAAITVLQRATTIALRHLEALTCSAAKCRRESPQ